MATGYTSLLGLALPVTGELSGTWGDVVNDYLTGYVDASVAGAQTISGSQTAVTLTTTNGAALSQAGSGSTGSAQYQIIKCTGNPASLLTITAPATSKTYIVINSTSTSQSVKIVGAGPTTGVTIATGQKALVAWNGSDFVQVGASAGGSTTQVQYNSSGALAGSASLTWDGTYLTAGSIKNSALTSGRVTYAGASGLLSDSANLTFNGTTLTAAGLSGPLNGTVGATTPSTVVATQVDITAQGDLRLQDSSGGEYVALQAPGTLGASYTLTMPTTDGDASQVLTTDGSGTLSWTTPSAGVSQAKVTAISMVFGF